MKIDISIIIPLYKGKKYIPQLLNMFNNCQTQLKQKKIEIIFVNDFPNENIEVVQQERVKVSVINHEVNRGIHQSRIDGLDLANGDWVIFFDQDDLVSENYLESQFFYIKSSDVVFSNGYWRNGKIIYKDIKEQAKARIKEFCYDMKNGVVSPGQIMIKKSKIPIEWKQYVVRKNGCDDLLLWCLLIEKKCKIEINPQCVYTHYEDESNMSINYEQMSKSLECVINLINNNFLLDEYGRNVLNNAFQRKKFLYDSYDTVLKSWDLMIKSMETYLKNYNGECSIYGYGVLGQKLENSLKNIGIKIKYIYDKDAESYINNKVTYDLSNTISEANVVIITPIMFYDEIVEQLKNYNKNINVVSLCAFIK